MAKSENYNADKALGFVLKSETYIEMTIIASFNWSSSLCSSHTREEFKHPEPSFAQSKPARALSQAHLEQACALH